MKHRARLLAVAVVGGIVVFAALGMAWAADTQPAVKHTEAQRKRGWSWTPRKDAATIDSGKRNNVFFVGEKVQFKLGASADNYEVRDYWGNLVDQGPVAEGVIAPKVSPAGWYKLYVYGKETTPEWGDVVGGTTFCIFRNDKNFPDFPDAGASGGGAEDQIIRDVVAMGPQRYPVDAGKPDESIKNLDKLIEIDKKMYLPYDPLRKRVLMIAFPGGTKGNENGVKKIAQHFKDTVKYYEPRNEPNFGSSGKDFVANEMKPFYDAVKSVDAGLKVMGPGTVSIDVGLQAWIGDFLKAGGGKLIDAFSFHNYNQANGDIFEIRRSMDSLKALLKKYGLENIELWQTEQGFPACLYGTYSPRRQGRWTMMMIVAFDQYGLTKEHCHIWYDKSHGFWDVPHWWVNDDGSLNPAGPLMRVFSEEVFGTTFQKALDFGPVGNKLFQGNLYKGPGKTVACFQSAGCTDGVVELKISGGDKVKVVSAFGVESELPVTGGVAKLAVPEIPVYVELGSNQTMAVTPIDYGKNLAMEQGVQLRSSGSGKNPVDPKIPNDIMALVNGQMESWYWNQKPGSDNWYDDTKEPPAWVELELPQVQTIAHVIIHCGPPWSWRGTMLDYELQYDQDGKWMTIEQVKEDPKVLGVFSPPMRCSVDSFFSERHIFLHAFKPVQAKKLRILAHEYTFGGGPNKTFDEACGQGPHNLQLREIEVYGK